MKANRAQVERALKAPDEYRFLLFHGPDAAGSRALARRVGAALGAEAERVELSGAELKADPARLADEAAAISLFGGRRFVLVEPAGDECLAAVEALLGAGAAGNPVALVAGALKPASKLLKLALAAPAALAFASYAPEGQEAERLAVDLARAAGLVLRSDVARRLAEGCAGNRAVLEQELAKLALYLDAAPDRPRPLDHEAIDAVGAAAEEGDLSRLVDSVGGGHVAALQAELVRLASEGVEGVPLVRAVLRRMSLLARLRAQVEQGNSVDAVMASQGKSLFWKEKPAVAQQLARWRAPLLAKSVERLLAAERQMKASGSLGRVAVDEELFAICRQAARLR
ncbi:MAG: DNA polymerase III subunit delta [Alphaproteobacteria bacterium]|nr:DNA polymerase III subunit delta [Alphaproteobacteria bacterium]MBV9372255.1 DNA polymerase III subunit delta [Alphaproteobacteria bacterium]MBV9901634.1 DNA polymerase III subunit delta [Alphaproteobacteria bacterium]